MRVSLLRCGRNRRRALARRRNLSACKSLATPLCCYHVLPATRWRAFRWRRSFSCPLYRLCVTRKRIRRARRSRRSVSGDAAVHRASFCAATVAYSFGSAAARGACGWLSAVFTMRVLPHRFFRHSPKGGRAARAFSPAAAALRVANEHGGGGQAPRMLLVACRSSCRAVPACNDNACYGA